MILFGFGHGQRVLVSAIKLAEEGDDLILRCVETTGLQTKASIDLRFANRKWKGDFKPYEIKTLRVNKKTGAVKEVNLLEE